ncbi:MAG: hypothetical protein FWC40_01710 [Proteobacteria bacterium]|nr:hypothetical protein [Pseudomonadota bacterium]
MIPTRLQDGLSTALLQWAHSAEADAVCEVIVRIVDGESWAQIQHNVRNAGLFDVEMLTPSCLKGKSRAADLMEIARCYGVSSVTPGKLPWASMSLGGLI